MPHSKHLLFSMSMLLTTLIGAQSLDSTYHSFLSSHRASTPEIPLAVPVEKSARRVLPYGDVRLGRCKPLTVSSAELRAGDSIAIYLVNESGKTFSKIRLRGAGLDTLVRKQPVFQYRAVVPADGPLILELRTPLSLRRAIAHLDVTAYRPTVPEPYAVRYDTLSRLSPWGAMDTLGNAGALCDTLLRVAIIRGGDTLTLRQETRQLGPDNRIHRQIAYLRTDTLPPGSAPPPLSVELPLRRFGTTRFPLRKKAQPGDTLLFSVRERSAKPVKYLLLKNGQGAQVQGRWRAASVEDRRAVTEEDPAFQLAMRSKLSLARQQVSIALARRTPPKYRHRYVVTDSFFQVKTTSRYDTILVPIVDENTSVQPRLNIEATPTQTVLVKVPEQTADGGQLLYLTYWIGIGFPAIQQYANLAVPISPPGALPPTLLAVGAVGVDPLLALPIPQFDKVHYYLTTPMNQRVSNFNNFKKNYGLMRPEALRRLPKRTNPATGIANYQFRIFFDNQDRISTYPLQVKMVGYYRLLAGTTHETVLVTTRTATYPLYEKDFPAIRFSDLLLGERGD